MNHTMSGLLLLPLPLLKKYRSSIHLGLCCLEILPIPQAQAQIHIEWCKAHSPRPGPRRRPDQPDDQPDQRDHHSPLR